MLAAPPTTGSPRRARGAALVLAVVTALALAGCSPGDDPPDGGPTAPAAAPTTATSAPLPTEVVGDECRAAPGRRVTQLPDLTVPAVELAEVRVPDVRIDGEAVPGPTMPAAVIPAQLVDAGCVIEHDAPGGCLGAVEITGAAIPATTIPAAVLPASALPDGGEVPAIELDAVVVPSVRAEAARTEQVCQIEVDGEVPTVSRAGIVRRELSRPGAARPGTSRPAACGDDGACVPALELPTVRIEPVRLPDVDVDPARLRARRVAPDVDVLEDGRTSAFVTPGDVLFDFDRADLRPEAEAVLGALAEALAAVPPGAATTVEGHTDDVGDAAYNVELSRRRAEAVAGWLRERGVAVDAVEGLGEAAPAHTNGTEDGRRANRRVVVTVRR